MAAGVYLSEAPDPPPPYTLYEYMYRVPLYQVLIHTGKEGGT
jgi:hypothetical protein